MPLFRREMAQMNREMAKQVVEDYDANLLKSDASGHVTLRVGEVSASVSIERLRAELNESEYGRSNLALLFSTAYRISEIYGHMKWTVFYSDGDSQFITSDSPVIRIFNSGRGGMAALLRPDIEVRFPLTRSAMLSLTHDSALIEKASRATEKERVEMLSRLPEVRLVEYGAEQVESANRTLAQHANFLILSGNNLPWASVVMKETSKSIRTFVRREAKGYRAISEIRYFP